MNPVVGNAILAALALLLAIGSVLMNDEREGSMLWAATAALLFAYVGPLLRAPRPAMEHGLLLIGLCIGVLFSVWRAAILVRRSLTPSEDDMLIAQLMHEERPKTPYLGDTFTDPSDGSQWIYDGWHWQRAEESDDREDTDYVS